MTSHPDISSPRFWDRLSPDGREAVQRAAVERRHRRGAALFREGDTTDSVIILVEGQLKLTKLSLDGREVILELRGPGDILGELAAVDGAPRSATGAFISNGRALHLTSADFNRLVDDEPSVASATLRTVAQRVRESSNRQLEMGTTDAMARVCSRLLQLMSEAVEEDDGSLTVKSPLSQQELADWAGVSRDAVVRSLKNARDAGWLVTGRQTFTVSDLDALRSHATGN